MYLERILRMKDIKTSPLQSISFNFSSSLTMWRAQVARDTSRASPAESRWKVCTAKLRTIIAYSLFSALLTIVASTGARATGSEAGGDLFQQTAALPDIVREFVFGAIEIEEPLAKQALLKSLACWLAVGFQLPDGVEQPRLAFAAPEKIFALRYRQLLENSTAAKQGLLADGQRSTVAIYIDSERTLYLPKGWNGHSPAELSILVHELVHHLQSLGGKKFECPQAREEIAYDAQRSGSIFSVKT
jgi:hypothetical protein